MMMMIMMMMMIAISVLCLLLPKTILIEGIHYCNNQLSPYYYYKLLRLSAGVKKS